jgi:predicted Zn-dependent peptidase
MVLKQYKLSSGISVIEDPIADAKSFTLLVMFRTGSRNETPDIWGISHFLEHMAFKGTPTYPSAALLAKELDSLGAMYNAFTGKEYTGYYIKGSKKVLPKAISIISEMTLAPIVLDEEVDKERGTIIEELNMCEDDPRRKIYDYFEQCVYENKQISQDIIGSKESLADIHAKQITDYREKYYISGNAAIAVSGFIPTDLVQQLEAAFSAFPSGKCDYLPAIVNPKKQINLCTKKTEQTHLAIGFPGLNVHNAERDVAQILATLLGGNMSSRMFSEVREKRGLAYYVKAYSDLMDDAGCFVTFAGINNGKVYDAVSIILDVYRGTKNDIPEDELRRTKDYIVGIMTLNYEDSEHRSETNALAQIYAEKQRTLDDKIAAIEAVTAEQVTALANRLFDEKKLCLALIGPFSDESKFASILQK